MKSRNKTRLHSTLEDIYTPKEGIFMTQIDLPSRKSSKKKVVKRTSKITHLPALTNNEPVISMKLTKKHSESRPKTMGFKSRKRMSMSATTIDRLSKPKYSAITEEDLSNTGTKPIVINLESCDK